MVFKGTKRTPTMCGVFKHHLWAKMLIGFPWSNVSRGPTQPDANAEKTQAALSCTPVRCI